MAVKPVLNTKKMVAIVTLFLSTVIVGSTLSHTQPSVDEAKRSLVAETLRIALIEKQLPTCNIVPGKPVFYLSDMNIEDVKLPPMLGVKLIIMSPEELKAKANREGDFLYLRFWKLDMYSDTAWVEIHGVFMMADDSPHMGWGGNWLGISFKHVDGEWEGTVTMIIYIN